MNRLVFQCTATLASPQGDEERGTIAVVVACWLNKANVARAGRRWYIKKKKKRKT